jgi:predicted RNA-binding protein with TRAM domain
MALIASTLPGVAISADAASPRSRFAALEDTYTLSKRVFKAGEVSRYKLDVKANIDGKDAATVSLTFKVTTRSVKPNGEFTLVNQIETATSTMDGKEQDISAFMPTVTVSRDKAGKVSSKSEGGNPQAAEQIASLLQALATIHDAYIPKDPVKLGDKWKVSINTPGTDGSGATKAEGEATFADTEVLMGVKSIKLKVITDIVTENSDDKTHSVSTLNIDPASGKLLKVSAKADGTSMGMKMIRQLELFPLPADAKAQPADK